ncbi:atg22p [Saccharomyces arboricola H-6]|uniref:Autophagy-related protein n=1 Tax=Saccharomyces arboricola (strain H-6 / AS 2.3317 / CBS 10644) TaxID=1160507 RepID=J8PQW3_SACAR|nr:atg22p [Saccharomyces arboricola H-6]
MSYGTIHDMSESVSNYRIKKAQNNIKGWYAYSFSSEPFVVSAVSTYIPLLLQQFARINGVKVHDHSMPCLSETGGDSDKCVLGLFNNRIFVDTSSFALYVFSLSVLFQTIIVISVSGMVDLWGSVKFKGRVLVWFSIVGALSTVAISKLNDTQIYSLAGLYIVANGCFGVINVVGNSLLPIFVKDSLKCRSQGDYEPDQVDSLTTLISGRGASIGYSSALIVQIVSMFLVASKKGSKQDVQVAILFVGIWWFVWQLPMIWLIDDVSVTAATTTITTTTINGSTVTSTNSPYPDEHERLRQSNWKAYLSYGWLSLFESFKHARLLKDVMIFLIAWFIISDSITTINSTAVLFSKTELHMSTLNLIMISILTVINAMLGAFMIPQFLATKLRWTSSQTLMYIIIWASFIPFYGILGFFFDAFGLKHKFEMFLLAIWYGLSLGGLSAVSRSVFSLIVPPGKESTFFSMFSITDKGSSILGPFLVGLLTDKTHNIRYSFYFFFLLLMLSLPVLNCLDVKRGRKEAEELSQMLPENERRLD